MATKDPGYPLMQARCASSVKQSTDQTFRLPNSPIAEILVRMTNIPKPYTQAGYPSSGTPGGAIAGHDVATLQNNSRYESVPEKSVPAIESPNTTMSALCSVM